MSRASEKIAAVRTFLGEVAAEMRKSNWPERQELIESTVVVIVFMLLLSLTVGVSDRLLIVLLRLIMPTG
jgi:preprotein translocase SecE subunit